MSRYPAPSRVALETPAGLRISAYVADIEDGLLTVFLSRPLPRRFVGAVRLTFRTEGLPSLGMTGQVTWAALGRATIALDHPLDRAVLQAWKTGQPAGVDAPRPADWTPPASMALAPGRRPPPAATVARPVRASATPVVSMAWTGGAPPHPGRDAGEGPTPGG